MYIKNIIIQIVHIVTHINLNIIVFILQIHNLQFFKIKLKNNI